MTVEQESINTKKSVFISYRREGGAEVARIIENFLHDRGFDVFLDVDSLGGGHFDEMILSHIKKRDNFILICNSGCFERFSEPSDWVRREVECAIENQKHIVPVLLEKFDWSETTDFSGTLSQLRRHNSFSYSHIYWKDVRERLINMLSYSRTAPVVEIKVLDKPATTRNKNQSKNNKVESKKACETPDLQNFVQEKNLPEFATDKKPHTKRRTTRPPKKTSEAGNLKKSSGNTSSSVPAVSKTDSSSNDWIWGCGLLVLIIVIIWLAGWGAWTAVRWVWNFF